MTQKLKMNVVKQIYKVQFFQNAIFSEFHSIENCIDKQILNPVWSYTHLLTISPLTIILFYISKMCIAKTCNHKNGISTSVLSTDLLTFMRTGLGRGAGSGESMISWMSGVVTFRRGRKMSAS